MKGSNDIVKRNGNLVLGTDYTDYMDFLRKSLVFVILSEAKNLPHAL